MDRLVVALCLITLTGCSALKMSRVRPDWDQVDRQRVKRLAVVTQPLPESKSSVGELWSRIARDHVNQNRDFLVKSNIALADKPAQALFGLCVEGIEGVLWLEPQVQRKGDGVEAQVKSRLLRCVDGEEVWAAEAGGSWESQNERYKERTADYVKQFGAEVEPYVAPTLQLLKTVLDTLPNPVLTEADVEEKIELGE